MNTFALDLHDGHGSGHFPAVRQFIGADASGSFGLLAGHAHFVAALRYGLARFIDDDGQWHYLALPSAVLVFEHNRLRLATARYFLGTERDAICNQLECASTALDSELAAARATFDQIDRVLVRRLGELAQQAGSGGQA